MKKLKSTHARGANLLQEFISSITLEVMEEPVCTIDGQTYGKKHILQWFKSHPTKISSPLTGKQLKSKLLIPDYMLRANMMTWVEQNTD